MANSKIVKYLLNGLKKGYTLDALENQLIHYGFNKNDVIVGIEEVIQKKNKAKKDFFNSFFSVKFVAILVLVLGFLGVIQSLFLFFGRGLFSFISIPLSNSAYVWLGVVVATFSLVLIWIGSKLYELKNWARIFIMILSCIAGAFSLFSFLVYLITVQVFDFFYFLMFLAFVFLVWHFKFNKRTVFLFKGR